MENESNPIVQPDKSDESSPQQDIKSEVETLNLETPKKKKFSWLKKPNITWNRNTILIASLLGVLLIVGVTTLALTRGNNSELSSEEVVVVDDEEESTLGVSITIQEGTIQTKQVDSGDWVDATKDTQITEGTAIKTVGATSRTAITFDDGSSLRLDANSEVELETVTTDRIVIKHVSGYTYNRVLPSDNLKYVVTSTDAQYEAQGTAFKTATTGDEQSVEVYQSSVVETGTNKTPKTGEKLIVLSSTTPKDNGQIQKLDIEEVKKDPFTQWNRELDEKDEKYKSSLGFLSDITAPDITLNTKDGEVVLLEPNAAEGTIEISGNTESGAKVTVLSKSTTGAQPVDVTVGSDGNFTTPVLTAPIGNSVFEFVVKDKTGNSTTKSLRITFQKKSQPVAGNAVSFVLTSTDNPSENKVKFSWTLKNISSPDGVKIVYSKSENPTLGGTKTGSVYEKSESSTTIKYSDFTSIDGSGKYFVKACVYDKASSTCGQYSNQVSVTIP